MKYNSIYKSMTLKIMKDSLAMARIVGILFINCLFFSCADQEQSLDDRIKLLKLETLPEVTHPANNPTSPDKVKLGKLLFFDPILSGEKDITCYTCHDPNRGYSEPLDLSIGPGGRGFGVNRIPGTGRPRAIRNSTTIINSAFTGLTNGSHHLDVSDAPQTWAIIRRSLEAQTFGALGNNTHMRGVPTPMYEAAAAPDSLAKRLKSIAEYVTLFNRAFPPTGNASSVTRENLGKAVAAFERSVISNNSPYDQYVKGNLNALTEQQKRGLLLYYGKANCSNCHSGPMFSDYNLYNLGIKDHSLLSTPDLGSNSQRLFRTPSLRNVALTSPYMHNGTIPTLRKVIEFYNQGLPENPNVSPSDLSIKIKPLKLSSDEIDDILSFLNALTDDDSYDKEIPLSVPSGLKVGGY
jgi:cytochrome c peroxidase